MQKYELKKSFFKSVCHENMISNHSIFFQNGLFDRFPHL